jgi:hypothetical protein
MLEIVGSLAVVRRGALSRAISKPINGSCLSAGGNVIRSSGSGAGLATESTFPCESAAVARKCSAQILACAAARAAHVAQPARPLRAGAAHLPHAPWVHPPDPRSAPPVAALGAYPIAAEEVLPPAAPAAYPRAPQKLFPSGGDSRHASGAPFFSGLAAPPDRAASPSHIHPRSHGTIWPYQKNRPGTNSRESASRTQLALLAGNKLPKATDPLFSRAPCEPSRSWSSHETLAAAIIACLGSPAPRVALSMPSISAQQESSSALSRRAPAQFNFLIFKSARVVPH